MDSQYRMTTWNKWMNRTHRRLEIAQPRLWWMETAVFKMEWQRTKKIQKKKNPRKNQI